MYGVRSSLGRMVLEKKRIDDYCSSEDCTGGWYTVELGRMSQQLHDTFIQSSMDFETQNFLEESRKISDSICLQLFYAFMTTLLKFFMTKTSINGILNRGHMFLFSKSHLSNLLKLDTSGNPEGGTVLDLGAGDGVVTLNLAKFYKRVYATETSKPMIWRLEEKGFTVIQDTDHWDDMENLHGYNLISCLNLLDRCPKPFQLLSQLKKAATDCNAQVLLGVVLPWSQYVEFQQKKTNDPSPIEYIHVKGSGFEEQLNYFVNSILEPNGFRVLRWTRLPYLCEGDTSRSYYVLNNAVLLLKPLS